jgi:fatty acid-binding protein DegV
LVQAAAEAAAHGLPGARINRLVRGLIPRIYTVFCLQSLSYLAHSGLIDPAQAVVGELLGITPFFILENGRLVPIQKVRSPRHLVDLVQEFISEFSNLKHIALVQGIPPFEQEARTLRDRLNGTLSTTAFSEHTLSTALATIIGPRGLGIVVMENCSGDL